MRIPPFTIILASACIVAAACIEPSAAANPGSGSDAKSAAGGAGSYGYRRASGAPALHRRDFSVGAARRRRMGATTKHSLQRRFAPALAAGARSAVTGLKQVTRWMVKHPRTVAALAAVGGPAVKSVLARAGAAPDLLKVFGALSAGLLVTGPVADGIGGATKADSGSAERPSDEAIALAAEYILQQARKKGNVPPSSFDPADRRPSDSDGLPIDPDLLPFPARESSIEKATSGFPGRPFDDSGDPDLLPFSARDSPIEMATSFPGRPLDGSGDPDLLPFSARDSSIEMATSFPGRPLDGSGNPDLLPFSAQDSSIETATSVLPGRPLDYSDAAVATNSLEQRERLDQREFMMSQSF